LIERRTALKFVTIVGARPQFIKSAPVSKCLRNLAREVIVHTGQHYDGNMSQVFFDELQIPKPDYNLNVGSGTHGAQTGQMLEKVEEVLFKEKPDCVLVYGDTNSTLAGALAAAKLRIPVAHVEAGLRSFNLAMPEEINRMLTDRLSLWLFCPTQTAVDNLSREGLLNRTYLVGNVMYDSLISNLKRAQEISPIIERLRLRPKDYILVTLHRPSNTDNPAALRNICRALKELASWGESVVFPAHPRTLARLKELGETEHLDGVIIPPTSYLEILLLQNYSKLIMTDSGGVQKEAFWLSVPCVTLREDTEWVETVDSGWNILAGNDQERILCAVRRFLAARPIPSRIIEDGKAADRISNLLCDVALTNNEHVADGPYQVAHI
jgi:UDP-GlcNAc3NAcA epimerase